MATAGENHPSEGMRLLLEREAIADDASAATYRATIYTPDDAFVYRAALKSAGEATLTLVSGRAAEADGEKRLLNLCKSTARASSRKVADGLPPWPERILRWRGPGRG